jgi:hypothetical protein
MRAAFAIAFLAFASPAFAGLLVSPAFAGGDDLYGDTEGHLPQFVGIARDVKTFKPIPGMRVIANLKTTRAGMITYSDDEGRFRIEGFVDGFDAGAVDISCTKPGYKPVNVIRRKISADPAAPIEVECLNERG